MNILKNKTIWIIFIISLISDLIIADILRAFSLSYYQNVLTVWNIFFVMAIVSFGIIFYLRYKNISKRASIFGSIISIFYGIGRLIFIFKSDELKGLIGTIQLITLGGGIFMLLVLMPLIISFIFFKEKNIILSIISLVLSILFVIIFCSDAIQGSNVKNSKSYTILAVLSTYISIIIICLENILKNDKRVHCA